MPSAMKASAKLSLIPRQNDYGRGLDTTKLVIVLVVAIVFIVCCVGAVFWRVHKRKNAYAREQEAWHKTRSSARDSVVSMSSQFVRPLTAVASSQEPRYSTIRNEELEQGLQAQQEPARSSSRASVMTLPVYSAVPHDNEGVLGREGERAGMDTVFEYPETRDEEEARREEEMAALYRIRQARRREADARLDRRRRRREARETGDIEMLLALHAEVSQMADDTIIPESTMLALEHRSKSRPRRISAVSYASLGVARHDGSRVRAASVESNDARNGRNDPTAVHDPIQPWILSESLQRPSRPVSTYTFTSRMSDASDEESEDALTPRRSQSRPRSWVSKYFFSRPRSAGPSRPQETRMQAIALDTRPVDEWRGRQPGPPPYGRNTRHRRTLSAPNSPTSPGPVPPLPRHIAELATTSRWDDDSAGTSSIPAIPMIPNFSIPRDRRSMIAI